MKMQNGRANPWPTDDQTHGLGVPKPDIGNQNTTFQLFRAKQSRQYEKHIWPNICYLFHSTCLVQRGHRAVNCMGGRFPLS